MASERKFVIENVRRELLREYMMEQTKRAGFGGLDIQRTPMGTRVTLLTERPGLVIGRKGSAIKTLTDEIQNRFKFDNPQIEVQEVENPGCNAQIMSEKLAQALEMGWHFRRAGHSTVRRIMESGAKGCLIVISGKLTGQRHRTEKFKDGHIKFCGETKILWMDIGFSTAKLKPGVIGVKVQIMKPNAKLPDEITVKERMVSDKELAEVKKVEAAKPEVPAEGTTEGPKPAAEPVAPNAPVAEPKKEKAPKSESKQKKAPETKKEKAPDQDIKQKTEGKSPAAKPEVAAPPKPEAKQKKAPETEPAKAQEPTAESKEPSTEVKTDGTA
ncbi:MAG: 30S ribosomal protein S3 [Methanobacteriota archaeon]